ncbi:hypothetical protein RB595_009765 [Gaeumannomyces hyphopodioides]
MSDALPLETAHSESGGVDQVSKVKADGRAGRVRALSRLKSWITVSEPSAQAFKQHQEESYSRAGTSRDDPTARTKLRAPAGSIPQDAIKPSGKGPDPEDAARAKATRTRALRQACAAISAESRASQTYSSHSSSSFDSTASLELSTSFGTAKGRR